MGIEAAIIHGKEDRLSLPVMMSDVAYPNYRANPNSPVEPPQPFLRFDESSGASSYTASDASTILTSI